MKKLKVLIILALVVCMASEVFGLTYGADNYKKYRSAALNAGRNDPIMNFMTEVEGKVGGETGTGTIYYVDSDVSSAGAGTSVTAAVATIQEGIDLCTANAGDIVYVMPGYAENAASAAIIDFDCAGMTLYCLGEGEDMPTVSLITTAAATIQISAADVTIFNLRISGNYTNGITEAVDITADGDGYRILGCEFRETSATKELLKMITVTADADEGTIAGCKFIGIATGTDSVAISLEGGSDYSEIIDNDFYGDWSGYVIDGSTAASIGLRVNYNRINNLDAGAGKTMAFHASTTGDVIGNTCYGNGATFAPVGDAMFVSPDNIFMQTENVETRTYESMFGAYRGDAAGTAGDSIFADFVLAQTDLDAILADTALWDTTDELQTILFGSATAGATATALATAQSNIDAIEVDTGTTLPATLTGISAAIASIDATGFAASATSDPASTVIVECTTLAGFGNDYFNTGWSLRCMLDISGVGTAPEGETWDIIDYVSSTGTFTVNAAFTAKVTTGDGIWVFRTEELNLDDKTMLGCAGTIRYIDSGTSGDGSGLTLENAYVTVALAEAACGAGDVVYIADGHDEEIGDLLINVANVSFIGLGEGDARPLLTLNDNTDEITIDAAGVTMKNIRIQSGVTACVKAFYIDDAGIGCTLDSIAFIDGEASTVDEFVDVIQVNAAASNLTVKNCTYYSLDATGHTNSFLDLGETTIDSPTIEGCTIFGMFAEAPIWGGAAAVPVNVVIKDNVISNTTTGQFCIEFTGAATGTCVNNMLYADTYGAVLNPGSLKCFGNMQTVGVDTAAEDIPLIAGKSYSRIKTSGVITATDQLFTVTGSPIIVTSFIGHATTAIGGGCTLNIQVDAAAAGEDYDLSTDVDIQTVDQGGLIVFDPAILEGVTTPAPLGATGCSAMPLNWFVVPGDIESDAGGDTGAITWYMVFTPVGPGCEVVPQ